MVLMKGITKRFGKLVANDSVDFEVKKGEVHALLGENGAGKSTLMSILFGLYTQDEGQIFINGELAHIKHPNDAAKYRIGMVHQHFKLVEIFSVLDNIILGSEETKNSFIVYKNARNKIMEIIEKYNLQIDLDKKISELTVGQQQKVEIIKMLYRDSDILIFDEPTAVLTPQEIKELIEIIKNFAKEGKAVILISHKLNEIKMSSDRCTILRRGKKIATLDVKDVTTEEMAELMVGRPLIQEYEKGAFNPKENILEVENLTLHGKGKDILKSINFHVRSGEIVGIAGIDGNGQTELANALTGLSPISSGLIRLKDKDISRLNIRKRYEAGLSHIPEDRHKFGLVLDFKLSENLVLQEYYKKPYSNYGILNHDIIEEHAKKLVENYDVRSSNSIDTIARSMSGGNQQKAILAREIEREHDLLLAFQPTRGLDVGAIENIHKNLIKERDRDRDVLLISYELEEIFNLSDRILVMYEGEITGSFKTSDITANELGQYMSGSKRSV
ncbi:ABC transporter ATP-binding protein [Acholeplasma laidlawii]|uniref:ABC transporter ATP-binding protein n=1 Tax=Acholeplasma laidlawii TaxID=2148 RepID=A0A553IIX7_ACHLA|nr:ABC transporter ATP-binding protein [Acholeplasma laidlawii]NWH11810.1 ABC transporter ATP-binding protein [Acholeplasma laidlawii]NWH12782.1 ABC transporter ATP-binding protein [Acholeplasma laidlawii]NWH14404.1 ABC transporter ATP-binding protein [Acholeplasma laidlawii]OAN19238.1 heme ABC transporter ATP-binding protein [Acholeplasma laidlawii]OED27029.1 heme ABC transporter ATP-binding protein [Acholeplasma laidlawii]